MYTQHYYTDRELVVSQTAKNVRFVVAVSATERVVPKQRRFADQGGNGCVDQPRVGE